MANILFQWLMTAYISLAHPFFVSMTDINYNSKDKELEISVRIFTDDLENTLRKYHNSKIDILHPADQEQMNAFVYEYIQKHLQLKVNDKAVDMNFVIYKVRKFVGLVTSQWSWPWATKRLTVTEQKF